MIWKEQQVKMSIINDSLRPSIPSSLLPCAGYEEVSFFLFLFFSFLSLLITSKIISLDY